MNKCRRNAARKRRRSIRLAEEYDSIMAWCKYWGDRINKSYAARGLKRMG